MTIKKKKTPHPSNAVDPSKAGLPEGTAAFFSWPTFKPWLAGSCLLLVLSFAWDHFNGGGVSCWPTKKIVLHQISHFSGLNEKCGGFVVGGVCCESGGKIIVSDIGKNRYLAFDLKGNFLNEASAKDCSQFSSEQVIDPQSDLHFIADRDYRRIKITDASGKQLEMIPLRDRPIAIALDHQRRIFISFDDFNSIQVFSCPACKFLGDIVIDNEDADYTYMDTTHFCTTEDGLLVAADRFSVRVFQLPPG
jgi:hypothetical protein